MPISSRSVASASAWMEMNSLPRWLISITDMPLPRQSSISSAAWRRTASGRVAGPGLKLKTRGMEGKALAEGGPDSIQDASGPQRVAAVRP